MNISKVLGYFYTKVFIAIVPDGVHTNIGILSVRGSSTQHNTRKFDGVKFNAHMNSFIEEYSQLSPLTYIALLSDVSGQGALPTCSKQQAGQFVDLIVSEYLCIDDGWMIYILRDELYQLQERYKMLDHDLIFSPFALIKQLYGEKLNGEPALFILNEESAIALAVFDHGVLHFASYEKIDPEFPPSIENTASNQDDRSKRYKIIEKTLDTYYHDLRFKSSFVNKIYLADTGDSSDTLIIELEVELFIDVEVMIVDIAYETARLAALEVGYAV